MKKIVFIIAMLVLTSGGVILFTLNSSQSNSSSPNGNNKSNSPLTMAEVAKHSSRDNCWTIIHDNVYDVTKYINLHPGGKEILRACGTDATVLFESRTTQDGNKIGSGTAHSEAAHAQLGQFLIGKLVSN